MNLTLGQEKQLTGLANWYDKKHVMSYYFMKKQLKNYLISYKYKLHSICYYLVSKKIIKKSDT